jgi:hypothetical protein
MVEVTNRALAYIMVTAMFVTVLSTGATLLRLDMLQTEQYLTGFATSPNATARLNLTGTTSITFVQDVIDWGTGYVNTSEATTCNLTTIGIPGHRFGCGNFTGQPGPLELENDGNQVVNVTLVLSETPGDWIGVGTLAFANATENASNTLTACTTGLLTSLTAINTTPITICEAFRYEADQDALDIGLAIQFQSSAPPGEKVVEVIATATAI